MWETQFWSLGYEDPLEKEWLQTWQSDFERRKRHTLFVVPGVSLNFSKNGSLYWLCSTLLVIFVLRTSPWHLSTPWAHHACSVESNSWPHGLLHAKLLCSWDSQGKILEWVATYSSKRSSQPGIEPTSPASIALTVSLNFILEHSFVFISDVQPRKRRDICICISDSLCFAHDIF